VTTAEAEVTAVHALGSATPSLNKALSQLQGELPRIKKTKTAEVKDQQGNRVLYKYDYADLGDVVADVGPLLAKCGLAFHCAPTINPADRREMILLWSLLHESGEEKAGEWPLGPVNQKPQSLGSAITYGRRYCFTAATNIVLEDDDDGQRAQQDHGTGQSAGGVWEKSTAAPPRKAATPKDSRPWAEIALEKAKAGEFKTEAEAWKLYREAAARTVKGDCTPDQQDHIQNVLAAWVRKHRRKASDMILRQLSETDDWRADVEALDGDDIEKCRSKLEELGRLKAGGAMNETRAGRIGGAIIALCPKAAIAGDDGV
jgi:hypothetical protein